MEQSNENEDTVTASLERILSDMRGLLQEHEHDVKQQLEACSANVEVRLVGLLRSRISSLISSGQGPVESSEAHPRFSQAIRISRFSDAAFSSVTDVTPGSARCSFIQQQFRNSVAEQSCWRRRAKSYMKEVETTRMERSTKHWDASTASQDTPDLRYRSGHASTNVLFDPDHIVDFVCVDRARDRGFGDEPSAQRRHSLSSNISMIVGNLSLLKKLRKLVKSWPFDLFCGLLIVGNFALLGVEVNFLASTGSVPPSAKLQQTLLNVWYFIELGLRYWAAPKQFCAPEEWRWNAMDIFTMIPSILDLTAETFLEADSTMWLIVRALRMLRIMRLLRIAKKLTYVREFRKMAFSLLASVQTLLWSTLLIFFFIYIFALWFTQLAAFMRYGTAQLDENVLQNVERYYGTIGQSIYTLFMSITNGISWGLCLQALLRADAVLSSAVFCTYVVVCCFGLLNIVTSVFVECAMLSTQHYKDLLVEENLSKAQTITVHMRRIFEEIDRDGSGTISFAEMEKMLDGKNAQLHAYLEALDLEVDDARAFFRLLDVDGSGNIDIDEFCYGCMKLKGEAKSFDLNCMIYEGRAMARTSAEFMYFVEQELNALKADWGSIAMAMKLLQGTQASQLPRDTARGSTTSSHQIHSLSRGSDGSDIATI